MSDHYDILRDTQYGILSTNLAEVGTDAISRQQAIETVGWYSCHSGDELLFADNVLRQLPPIQPEIIYCKDCSKHNVSISKAPYPFREYICPLIVFRGEAQGHEFDYQFCAYGKRREVTT